MATNATGTAGYAVVDDTRGARPLARLSWGAIFGGVVIAVAVQLLLGILGTGIGLSMVDPTEGTMPSAAGFGIGAGIYWLITTIVALGAGGYAAARVSSVTERFDALVHGLVVWDVTLILTLYLLTSAVCGIIGGAFRTVGTVAARRARPSAPRRVPLRPQRPLPASTRTTFARKRPTISPTCPAIPRR